MNQFTEHSQVVITTKHYTITAFHTSKHSTLISTSLHWNTHSQYHCTTAHLKSSNHTLSLHRLTSNSSSTTNFPWISLTANCLTVMLGTFLYSRYTDTHHRKQVTWPLLLSDATANHRSTCHVIPTHCCVTSLAHALYSNCPWEDTKETLPQYCCMAHAIEHAHRAAAQRCLEQIRHNIFCIVSFCQQKMHKNADLR
jgi:hypothetical protein